MFKKFILSVENGNLVFLKQKKKVSSDKFNTRTSDKISSLYFKLINPSNLMKKYSSPNLDFFLC